MEEIYLSSDNGNEIVVAISKEGGWSVYDCTGYKKEFYASNDLAPPYPREVEGELSEGGLKVESKTCTVKYLGKRQSLHFTQRTYEAALSSTPQ